MNGALAYLEMCNAEFITRLDTLRQYVRAGWNLPSHKYSKPQSGCYITIHASYHNTEDNVNHTQPCVQYFFWGNWQCQFWGVSCIMEDDSGSGFSIISMEICLHMFPCSGNYPFPSKLTDCQAIKWRFRVSVKLSYSTSSHRLWWLLIFHVCYTSLLDMDWSESWNIAVTSRVTFWISKPTW